MAEKKLRIQYLAPDTLIPYELNAKKHDAEQVARIVRSIQIGGEFDVPIVVDRHGVIIKGHGRRLAAIELGMTAVPVIVLDKATPEQVKAMRLADNRAAISDIDSDLLRADLQSMGADVDLLKGIFDAKEFDFLKADLGQVNEEAFVTDMSATLEEQKADLSLRTEAASAARLPLAKAFGIKDIPASGQLLISRLMARAEATTQLKGAEALLSYLELTHA